MTCKLLQKHQQISKSMVAGGGRALSLPCPSTGAGGLGQPQWALPADGNGVGAVSRGREVPLAQEGLLSSLGCACWVQDALAVPGKAVKLG